MMVKVLLLVCLVPLVMGSPEEMFKMFSEMKGEGEGEGGMSGENHYEGDGDCPTKEAAMKKKYEMFQKMMKMKEMMEKKKKMEEYAEKMQKFKMFMSMMEKKKEMEAMEQKKKMYEMWQKHEEMKKKQEKEDEFNDLIESFKQKKHKFVFSLTHHFLTMCKCGQIDAQMTKMFMGEKMGNSSSMADDMAEEAAMEAWAAGDMAKLAMKLKKMSKEQQKQLYMAGLIKSMCTGATTFIKHAQQFEETYMHGSTGAPETTTNPFVSN